MRIYESLALWNMYLVLRIWIRSETYYFSGPDPVIGSRKSDPTYYPGIFVGTLTPTRYRAPTPISYSYTYEVHNFARPVYTYEVQLNL